MLKKRPEHQWLHSSALFAYLAVGAYLIAYIFQVGFLGHFGIPPTFIETSLNNIAITFFAIIPTLSLFLLKAIAPVEFFSWIFPRFKPKNLVIRLVAFYSFLIVFLAVIPYAISIVGPIQTLVTIGFIVAASIAHSFQLWWYKSLKSKSVISYFAKRFGTLVSLTICYLGLLWLAYVGGTILANKIDIFQVFNYEESEYGIIYQTAKYALATPILDDAIDVNSGYRIFNLDSISTLIKFRQISTRK